MILIAVIFGVLCGVQLATEALVVGNEVVVINVRVENHKVTDLSGLTVELREDEDSENSLVLHRLDPTGQASLRLRVTFMGKVGILRRSLTYESFAAIRVLDNKSLVARVSVRDILGKGAIVVKKSDFTTRFTWWRQ